MRIATVPVLLSVLLLGPTLGCAMQQKKVHEEVTSGAAIDCRTAEGEIRVLQSEKTHVAEQMLEGVTAITPAGIVIGVVTGTEGTKIEVAIGEYNDAIDRRITDIKSTCGL